jgi:short-subunit dehydrogenase
MFKDKVVIITGASSGIGKACAEKFASKGANVVLAARGYDELCYIAKDLEQQYSIKALAVQCDVSKEEDCKRLVDQAILSFYRIDILVNNAGISMRALFKDLDLSVLKTLMDVNFWGTVYCCKYALPSILASKGIIIGVSSIAGYRGLPGRTGYSASKFAMNGFLESLRVENLKNGVHIMVVCPGFTASNIRNTALDTTGNQHGETSMDENKMMSAMEVAKHIVKGITARKRTLILTGQGKMAVLLNKFFPSWLDSQIYRLFAKEKNPLIK